MKIKYKNSWYNINAEDARWINKQKRYLFIRRILRGGKRVFLYSKQTWLVVLSAIIFSTLILIIGYYSKQYNSIVEGVWDIKTFFFSSIFVVLFGTVVSAENRRNQRLKIQYLKYIDFLFASDQFIGELCKIGGFNYEHAIFLTEEHLSHYFDELEKYMNSPRLRTSRIDDLPRHMTEKGFVKSICENYLYLLLDMKKYLNSGEIVGNDDYYGITYIDYPISELRNAILIIEELSLEELQEESIRIAERLAGLLIHVIPQMRRPWRWDYEKNKKIRQVLNEKSEHVDGMYDHNKYWEIGLNK